MDELKINALIATSYNLHFGEKDDHVMTPSEAATLKRADKIALVHVLREKGGSDLFSAQDADEAFITLTS
ncbi:hypothetical protein [Orrella marina]|uniref:Uncharacterized protein n=1 Tax=Orrella marina TaxID=2163011 RepID=A0A2R4XNZ6_9BURK|nr:hypothetical protein [Orrella marina]AWB35526.1 hypothetical protein DBV39_19235 [Orrella marina]